MINFKDFEYYANRLSKLYSKNKDIAGTQIRNATTLIETDGPTMFVPFRRVILGLRGKDMLVKNCKQNESPGITNAIKDLGFSAFREGIEGFDALWIDYQNLCETFNLAPSNAKPTPQSVRRFFSKRHGEPQTHLTADGQSVRDAFNSFDEAQSFPPGFGKPDIWFVRHPESQKPYPAKVVWGYATGWFGREFTSQDARNGLEKLGFKVVETKLGSGTDFPDELPKPGIYPEGAQKKILVNRYERSSKNRQACIDHFRKRDGAIQCQACKLVFENRYGDLGINFIHVHHTIPLHEIGENYVVDPINELVPICPNCHAMLHRGKELLKITDLIKLLNSNA